jgi:endonuclease III
MDPRVKAILRGLRRSRPDARVELQYGSPFELLVATILSAQCTDARVNQVTPELFRRFPTPQAMADAPPDEIEAIIRPTGFFHAKARALQGASRQLVQAHGGEVPRTMEELKSLTGVGRKTANVVLGAAYGIPSGIVVDTHMARVARRLRLTRSDDPIRVEQDLMKLLPSSQWVFFSTAMVLHGRYVCLARRPRCGDCAISGYCPSRDRVAASPPRRPQGRARD